MSARTPAECITAAEALEGAIHLLDDEESAQTLARLADQWRAEAAAFDQAPHKYRHVSGGRWMCDTCNEFIVNRDCRENQRWAAGRTVGT